jgi:hypothetical protein
MSFAQASAVIVPSGDDWLVTVCLRNRRVWTRRISPGTMPESEAVRMALLAHGVRPGDVADCSVRRVGDQRRLEVGPADDPLARLLARLGDGR